MRGRRRYLRQLEIWREVIPRLSGVSRQALLQAWSENVDPVETGLHWEAVRAGVTTVEEGVARLEAMIAAAEGPPRDGGQGLTGG